LMIYYRGDRMTQLRERHGQRDRRRWWLAISVLVLLGAVACGGRREPAKPLQEPHDAVSATPGTPDEPIGTFHIVRPGETVWAISRAYNRTVESIAEANDLADVNRIHAGQRLLIPGAPEIQRVPSSDLYSDNGGRSRDQGPALAWPVPGREILSRFGASRRTHRHTGLDIRGKRGDPVTAAAAGRVTFSSSMSGYGKTVIVDHGGGLQTLYAHNKALLVRVGEHVSRGQEIATVGRSGNATTEHCHFEVRLNDVAVDPLAYLSR
jgi:murein DD-endopeptidase MepM/ murein hydrolase activator NlpD